jgi:hypothetical protein
VGRKPTKTTELFLKKLTVYIKGLHNVNSLIMRENDLRSAGRTPTKTNEDDRIIFKKSNSIYIKGLHNVNSLK